MATLQKSCVAGVVAFLGMQGQRKSQLHASMYRPLAAQVAIDDLLARASSPRCSRSRRAVAATCWPGPRGPHLRRGLTHPAPLVNAAFGTRARRREGMPPQSSDHRQGLHVTSAGVLALALILATAAPPARAAFDFATVVHRAERLPAPRRKEAPNKVPHWALNLDYSALRDKPCRPSSAV